MLCNNVLSYLIYPGSAKFEQVDLFEVIDDAIPPEWHYACFNQSDSDKSGSPVQAMWGYKELVRDINHNSNLSQGSEEAIKVFFRRKLEIDNWEDTK